MLNKRGDDGPAEQKEAQVEGVDQVPVLNMGEVLHGVRSEDIAEDEEDVDNDEKEVENEHEVEAYQFGGRPLHSLEGVDTQKYVYKVEDGGIAIKLAPELVVADPHLVKMGNIPHRDYEEVEVDQQDENAVFRVVDGDCLNEESHLFADLVFELLFFFVHFE